MKVVDFEDKMWFLLEHNSQNFMDVNCNHSAFGFSILIGLNEVEEQQYLEKGHPYLNELASEFSDNALSKYKDRDESNHYEPLVSEATRKWKKKNTKYDSS
jgi:hypothetical protein